MKKTNGVWTKKRYGQINSYLKDVAKDLKKKVKEEMSVEEFIEYELLAQQKLYKKHLKGNENLRFPTVEQAVTTATFGSYTESSSYENYLEALESQFYNVWDSNVREGYLTGQTTNNIVRKVVGKQAKNAQLAEAGAMHSFRNSVMANTRTALQAMASDTRKLIMERNADLFSGYEWVSTLDRRTCLVCGSLDGQIKLKITEFGEQPPIHFNCRCLIIPKVEGYDELDDDTRASKSGQVDSDMSYDAWLKTQPEEVQKDVLGKTRYEIFYKTGKVDEFVNDGKVINLVDLASKYQITESIPLRLVYGKKSREMLMNETFESDIDLVNKQRFINDVENGVYRTNCPHCCHAYEIRQRGFDVVAKPNNGKGSILNDDFLNVFSNYEKIKLENVSTPEMKNTDNIKSQISNLMKEWGDGSRAEIRLAKNPIKGHLFTAINLKGEILFVDSQSGMYNVERYFDIVKEGLDNNYIVRTDKLKFTKEILNYVERRK